MEALRRFFLPHPETHRRPHAFHPFSLLFFIALFLAFHVSLQSLATLAPGVLGYATQIDAGDVFNKTNEERTKRGVEPLKENTQLTLAAAKKAEDMMRDDYWAHVSPAGRQPWDFISDSGYTYVFAGENLARNFEKTDDVVAAWLASSSHRENLLNGRYSEIGVAVKNGILQGVETTLVVQMFGTPIPTTLTRTELPKVSIEPSASLTQIPSAPGGPSVQGAGFQISPVFPRQVALFILSVLLAVLVADIALLWRRRVFQMRTHTVAHAMLLTFVLSILWYTGGGRIL